MPVGVQGVQLESNAWRHDPLTSPPPSLFPSRPFVLLLSPSVPCPRLVAPARASVELGHKPLTYTQPLRARLRPAPHLAPRGTPVARATERGPSGILPQPREGRRSGRRAWRRRRSRGGGGGGEQRKRRRRRRRRGRSFEAEFAREQACQTHRGEPRLLCVFLLCVCV